jgi:DNA-binding GntR family transcriptional regulator
MSKEPTAKRSSDAASLLRTPIPPDATLADRAYFELRDRIVTLQLPPGALIRDEHLMEELEMSRTPIREALLRLSLQGLVEVVPRRGAFVRDVNAGDVGAIYELRRELETAAAGWAAARRSPRDFDEIDALISDLRNLGGASDREDDARAHITLDQRAHFLIYRLSGNPCLEDVLRSYYFQSARVWFLASGRVTMESPFDSQIALLEAIRAQDVDRAREMALRHSQEAEEAIRRSL